LIIAAHDGKGYNLHMIRPSGECYVFPSIDFFQQILRVITIAPKGKENKRLRQSLKRETLRN